MPYSINFTGIFNITPLPSLLSSINTFFTGVQAGIEMIEQMAKERNIPDLKGSESLEFLKIDYVNYNFTK